MDNFVCWRCERAARGEYSGEVILKLDRTMGDEISREFERFGRGFWFTLPNESS